jgi:hypothetical protein
VVSEDKKVHKNEKANKPLLNRLTIPSTYLSLRRHRWFIRISSNYNGLLSVQLILSMLRPKFLF